MLDNRDYEPFEHTNSGTDVPADQEIRMPSDDGARQQQEWREPYSSFDMLEHMVEREAAESGPIFDADGYPPIPPKRERKKRHGAPIALAVAGCMVFSAAFGFGGGYLANQLGNTGSGDSNPSVITQSVVNTSAGSGSGGSMTVADVANAAANSVVEITTETVTNHNTLRQYVSEGAGSGVIITKDGYILTNHHVIDGAGKITVRTKDGASYDAVQVGTDEESDLAVIKIQAEELQPAVFGDSDKLVVGETAVAIGNPLGELGGTVTSGIISALDREVTIGDQTMSLLQTSAAINPGNSGGGLFNSAGELIGIVNAKSSGTGIEGLGFAIPGNTAKSVAQQLIQYGYVKGRVSLGFTPVEVNDAQTAMMYRVSKTGVYVSQVTDKNAGLQAGDLLVSVDGKEIASAADLTSAVKNHSVGDTVSVVVLRNQQQLTVSLTLKESVPQNSVQG